VRPDCVTFMSTFVSQAVAEASVLILVFELIALARAVASVDGVLLLL